MKWFKGASSIATSCSREELCHVENSQYALAEWSHGLQRVELSYVVRIKQ